MSTYHWQVFWFPVEAYGQTHSAKSCPDFVTRQGRQGHVHQNHELLDGRESSRPLRMDVPVYVRVCSLTPCTQSINSLVALHKIMPEHLRETKPLRYAPSHSNAGPASGLSNCPLFRPRCPRRRRLPDSVFSHCHINIHPLTQLQLTLTLDTDFRRCPGTRRRPQNSATSAARSSSGPSTATARRACRRCSTPRTPT